MSILAIKLCNSDFGTSVYVTSGSQGRGFYFFRNNQFTELWSKDVDSKKMSKSVYLINIQIFSFEFHNMKVTHYQEFTVNSYFFTRAELTVNISHFLLYRTVI
jgi:hypothetical protein